MPEKLEEVGSEDEWQNYVSTHMDKFGWYVKEEVTASEDRKRADIIAKNARYGDEWIGLELKYWHSPLSGARLISAINQIVENYRHKHWPNKEIRLWAIAPYIGGSHEESTWGEKCRFAERVVCNISNELGIGYLQCQHDYATIFFGQSSNADNWITGIPAFPIERDPRDRYEHPQNLSGLARLVENRQPSEPLGGDIPAFELMESQ